MTVPKDHVESGSGLRGWVQAKFYGKDESEVDAKRKRYFAEYPPQGYDTRTTDGPKELEAGYWMCRINRYSTCG